MEKEHNSLVFQALTTHPNITNKCQDKRKNKILSVVWFITFKYLDMWYVGLH